ncbi:MBL fold metallo-hydrolase [Roseomonas gilardii subsp. gilardii]|uniref:MBL fold metallo-hydrolase n=1 Tax=Roseomonas gilardii TaxID=257708 RepID=UPI001FF8E2B4|nr:MBL fold metallo-hydrolase [Roseomonas gilardii]UPG73372.1 MBL fold metallo-hydrolase [Roseomonas gilardii subsp. gilardii]
MRRRNLLLAGMAGTLAPAWSGRAAETPPAEDLFRVTVLGSGTPVPSAERFGNATLVECGGQRLLFDFGRGCTIRLWQLRIPLGSIDAHFLTHHHSDHTVGLPDLWLTGWLRPPYGRRKHPFLLYGPPGTEAMARGLRAAYAADIDTRLADERNPEEGIRIDAHDVAPGLVHERDGLRVLAFANDHGDKVKPSYGYRIEYRGRVAVLAGDTRYNGEVVQQGRGADLFLHPVTLIPEALLAADPAYHAVYSHLASPTDAARAFREARPRLAALYHVGLNGDATLADLRTAIRAGYDGPLAIASDLTGFVITRDAVSVVQRDAG